MDQNSHTISDAHIKVFKYIKENSLSPSYREIAAACEISVSKSHKLVMDLKDLEYLTVVSGKCRTIRV